jgi:hypothetical protein
MVCFQTKNPNLGRFWRVLEWKILLYFMTIWNILWPFGIIYGRLVCFVVIWYILPILVGLDNKNMATPVVCSNVQIPHFYCACLTFAQKWVESKVNNHFLNRTSFKWNNILRYLARWPDWTNFRLLGENYWNIQKSTNFPAKVLCLYAISVNTNAELRKINLTCSCDLLTF